jgi:capsular exopolysaccharide synthesis family protein
MPAGSIAKTLVSLTSPASFAAEQYQGLRLKVERLRDTRDVRALAISSPGVGDGKTVTSINLAGALARGPRSRVLLIDADLRRPAIAQHLGIDVDGPGLADVIFDERVEVKAAIRRPEGVNFAVIPAGSAAAPVHELLRSPRLEWIIQQARRFFDFVVLDTPPLVPVSDSVLISRSVDGLLVVVAANETPRKLLEESLNLLDASKVLGIVFNGDSRPLFGYYDAYYRRRFPGRSTAAQEA